MPNDAEPGGHYATIFFGRAGGTVGNGSGVGVAEQVGVLLLVRVPGNIRESLNVESFRVIGPSTVNRRPVAFELRVKNTGSVHERPAGQIVITNMVGSVVAKIPANPNNGAVLPASIRRFGAGWDASAPIAKGGFFAEAANEWKNFGFGKYTARVDATYGPMKTPLERAAVSFWIIPWHLIAIAAGLLIVLIVLIMVYNKMLIRAALRKARR